MSKILVTGANGQLGQCIKWVVNSYINTDKNNEYVFVGREDLDISNGIEVDKFLKNGNFDFIINCAAFTNVNGCKDDIHSFIVNSVGPLVLTKCAKKYDVKLVHISTDYVFDGDKNIPYVESDITNPLNCYGESKLIGEEYVLDYSKGYVFRTSWLYSIYGKNFLMTIANRIKEEKETEVVIDQVGTPTSARSLAKFLVWFVENCDERNIEPGLYHFSNEGVCSWYDFAVAIEDCLNVNKSGFKLRKNNLIFPITTEVYENKNNLQNEPRPSYSVLSNEKIKKYYPDINHWLIDLNNEIKFLGINGFWGN